MHLLSSRLEFSSQSLDYMVIQLALRTAILDATVSKFLGSPEKQSQFNLPQRH